MDSWIRRSGLKRVKVSGKTRSLCHKQTTLLGKVFPKLRRKGHSLAKENGQDCHNEEEEEEEEEDIASDYVFRIISICEKPDTISE